MLRVATAICLLVAVSAISLRREGAGGNCPASDTHCLGLLEKLAGEKGELAWMKVLTHTSTHSLTHYLEAPKDATTASNGKCVANDQEDCDASGHCTGAELRRTGGYTALTPKFHEYKRHSDVGDIKDGNEYGVDFFGKPKGYFYKAKDEVSRESM